jgi:hypothetical protein
MVEPLQANGFSPPSRLAPYYYGFFYYGLFYYGSFLTELQPMNISLSALAEQRFEQLDLRRPGNQTAQHAIGR